MLIELCPKWSICVKLSISVTFTLAMIVQTVLTVHQR